MQNLWDYTKRGKELSASNLAAAQRRIEAKQYEEDNKFNPINAAIAASAAFFTGGASLAPEALATTAAAAAMAPRGKVDPVGAGLGGYTKAAGVQAIGEAIGKGGVQSLASPENINKVIGTAQAFENKPVESLITMSSLTDFDKTVIEMAMKAIADPNVKPDSKEIAAKLISSIYKRDNKMSLFGGKQTGKQTEQTQSPSPSQMISNFPQGTQQAFQNTNPTPGIQNIVPEFQKAVQPPAQTPVTPTPQPESPFTRMFSKIPDLKEEAQTFKTQEEVKKIKSTKSGEQQASSIYTEIENASTPKQLNDISARVNEYMKYAPNVQKEVRSAVSKRKAEIRKDERDRKQDELNRKKEARAELNASKVESKKIEKENKKIKSEENKQVSKAYANRINKTLLLAKDFKNDPNEIAKIANSAIQRINSDDRLTAEQKSRYVNTLLKISTKIGVVNYSTR